MVLFLQRKEKGHWLQIVGVSGAENWIDRAQPNSKDVSGMKSIQDPDIPWGHHGWVGCLCACAIRVEVWLSVCMWCLCVCVYEVYTCVCMSVSMWCVCTRVYSLTCLCVCESVSLCDCVDFLLQLNLVSAIVWYYC